MAQYNFHVLHIDGSRVFLDFAIEFDTKACRGADAYGVLKDGVEDVNENSSEGSSNDVGSTNVSVDYKVVVNDDD